jgi:ketosteroid isomerase-like protein
MSQENVEAVRRAFDALNRRDVEAYLACCTDDVEMHPATAAVEGAYDGEEGIRHFFADIEDTAPDFQLEVERIEAIGADRVLGFERAILSGRSSGVTWEEGVPLGSVWDFVDGKVRRVQVFTDRRDALKAVGLAE